MRVLVTFRSGSGHFHPIAPYARALQTAGHDVAFATAASFAPQVEASGFRCFPAGIDGAQVREAYPELSALAGTPLREFMRGRVFPAIYPERMLPDLVEIATSWAPDLVLRDSGEFAGCVVAEYRGIPHASIEISQGTAFPYQIRLAYAPNMDVLRASVGLPSDPGGDMLFRYLHLVGAPPALQAPAAERPPTTHFIRRVVFDLSGDERLPAWVAALPARPTIFATLGTVFNKDASVFAAVLAALRDEPINLILAVGRDVDPAQFGPCPENVHIERYIPLSLLMPHCDLVLCHAGFGTVMAALEHGIPLVNIPISADNPEIAARCAELGFSVTVPADERTPEAIRSAVRTVLASAAYRTHAERLRDEMAALPSLEHAVVLLERLASEKTPVIDHQ